MPSSKSIAYLQQQLDYSEQKRAEELAEWSEKLAAQTKESRAMEGAWIRKVDTLQEMNKHLLKQARWLQDTIASRDRNICYQETLQSKKEAQYSTEVNCWQQQFEAVPAENKMLKEQVEQMGADKKLLQQQVSDLQQQVAQLTSRNNQLEQQMSRMQAPHQVQHQETRSCSLDAVVRVESGEQFEQSQEQQQPSPAASLLKQQQQQQQLADAVTALYERYMVLSLGTLCAETARRSSSRASSSRASSDVSIPDTPDFCEILTGPGSDAEDDIASTATEDVDVICHIVSSTPAPVDQDICTASNHAKGVNPCCGESAVSTNNSSSHTGSSKPVGVRLLRGVGRGVSWCCRRFTNMMVH